MLKVDHLSYKYKKKGFGIKNVNFKLEDGYFAVLLGKNGAGKTTLLRTIYQMYHGKEGKVLWEGEAVTGKNLTKFRREVAYIEDEGWCVGYMTADENKNLFKKMYPTFDEECYVRNLEIFGFGKKLSDTTYANLSKGEQMKFQIAFVLARHPKLVIMDEPFANLDPVVKTDLIEALQQNVRHHDMSVLLSTHLVEDINDITDYIGIMEDGSLNGFSDREELTAKYETDSLREICMEVLKNGKNR